MINRRIDLAPSILSADFYNLGDQINDAIDAGCCIIHIDVMDGCFVPNLSIGPQIVKAISENVDGKEVILDVHLMVENPDNVIPLFAKAGAHNITVHVEATKHLHRSIQLIKSFGCTAGVTLNPGTPLSAIEPVIHDIEYLVIMSVNPGFGGQKFIDSSLKKIRNAREILVKNGLSHIRIEVDGGVKISNAIEIINAGADILIAGSAIFNTTDSVKTHINTFLRKIDEFIQHN